MNLGLSSNDSFADRQLHQVGCSYGIPLKCVFTAYTTISKPELFYLTDKAAIIQELMERHKLDEDDIRRMTPHSEQYVIPCLQTHVKRSSLILYRTVNRKEAEHEASS